MARGLNISDVCGCTVQGTITVQGVVTVAGKVESQIAVAGQDKSAGDGPVTIQGTSKDAYPGQGGTPGHGTPPASLGISGDCGARPAVGRECEPGQAQRAHNQLPRG
jgi:hypothetical protein